MVDSHRRRFLGVTGAAIGSPLLTGCLTRGVGAADLMVSNEEIHVVHCHVEIRHPFEGETIFARDLRLETEDFKTFENPVKERGNYKLVVESERGLREVFEWDEATENPWFKEDSDGVLARFENGEIQFEAIIESVPS